MPDLDMATILDCISMYEILGKAVVLEDGHVVGFVKENRT